MFRQTVKKLIIDACILLAILVNLYFLYSQMWPFAKAAIVLNYINGQTLLYMAYSFLLLLFPVILLFDRILIISKPQALRMLFYTFATVIIAGTVCDLIKYKFFLDYTFKEGDTVFVNIMWNMPNLLGAMMSVLIAVLYISLGKWIKRRRKISYFLYLTIFILSFAIPLGYTFLASGMFPRAAWLQKAAFTLLEQFLILMAFTTCATSRSLWVRHILLY